VSDVSAWGSQQALKKPTIERVIHLGTRGDPRQAENEKGLSSFLSASHAARYIACHGVGSHPVPVALVGECSIPVA